MRFVDEATISVRSGNGGNGCASFRRERFIPKGGPNGGDGGKGGDVILRAAQRLITLQDFRLKRSYTARNGQPGMGKDRYGKAADDLVLELPVGTLVHEVAENEDGTESERLVADLVHDGQEVVVCHGGQGGRGNIHFKSSTNQAPRYAEEGTPGEEKRLRLELKILADVGLLGLPNAGKSTLITALSQARPKIAAYPFTTLTPNLGVLEGEMGERLVMADIPGLIEGASQGVGLGHTFLKHVERTRFLVHLLSAEEVGKDDPFAGFNLLDDELDQYDPALARKPQLRVVNKIDLLSPEQLEEIRTQADEARLDLRFISALTGQGVDALEQEIWERFKTLDESDESDKSSGPLASQPAS